MKALLFEAVRLQEYGRKPVSQRRTRLLVEATIPAERRLAGVMQAPSDKSDPKVVRDVYYDDHARNE